MGKNWRSRLGADLFPSCYSVQVCSRSSLDGARELVNLFKVGAEILLCGSASKLARSTGETLQKIIMEAKGCSAEGAEESLQKQTAERCMIDIFG